MIQRWHRRLGGLILAAAFLAAGTVFAGDKLYIVTTLPDLADITASIGGDVVTVESLARGVEDPHGIPIKPSFVPKLNRAQAVVVMGLEYEHSWIPALLAEARNPKILKGQSGYIDVSVRVTPKEVPTDLSRAQGELHPAGNPHFNLDPEDGRLIAQAIAEGLTLNFPQHRAKFEANLKAYLAQLSVRMREWETLAKPLKGVKFVSYHQDFTYFADRFGRRARSPALVLLEEVEARRCNRGERSHHPTFVQAVSTTKRRGSPWPDDQPGFGPLAKGRVGFRNCPASAA